MNHHVAPVLPSELVGFRGTVRLLVYIDADGVVKSVEFAKGGSSGNEIADEAALDAVSQYEYIPAVRNGQYVEAVTTETITFD